MAKLNLNKTDTINSGITKESLQEIINNLKKELQDIKQEKNDLFTDNQSKENKIKELLENMETLKQNPNKNNYELAITEINKSDILQSETKKELLNKLATDYYNLFNITDINKLSDNYDDLLNESKFLYQLSENSFILSAMRLKKIRDNELYKTAGYDDFKEFITNEIPGTRQLAYNYIDIAEYFIDVSNRFDTQNNIDIAEYFIDVSNRFDTQNNIEYSKLLPFIPLLKSKDIAIDEKIEIKRTALNILENHESKSKAIAAAKELKEKYHISINKPESKKSITKNTNKAITEIQDNILDNTIKAIIKLLESIPGYKCNFQSVKDKIDLLLNEIILSINDTDKELNQRAIKYIIKELKDSKNK